MSAGGSVSNSRSESDSTQGLGTLDPIAGGLANLFGGRIKNKPGGGFTTKLPSNILPNAFTPESFSGLSGLTDTLNPVEFDLNSLAGFGQGAINTIGEASQTGLIGPAQDLFGQLFNERISGLQEQFGGFGLGPNDSDFQSAALREAQLGSTQLADLAQSRKLQASTALPGAIGDILGLEGASRATARARTPGGQQLELLLNLAGIQTESGNIGISKENSRSKSESYTAGLK